MWIEPLASYGIDRHTNVRKGAFQNTVNLGYCRISANCYYMNYFPGYGEINVRVYINGWHKQNM